MTNETLLSVRDLSVTFNIHQGKKWPWSRPAKLKAVRNIDFDLIAGKTLGIVGESGSGKSTLVRAIAGLTPTANGTVTFEGDDITHLRGAARQPYRQSIQMIFQDPTGSLNPRMNIGEIVAEPLRQFEPSLSADERQKRVYEMLDRVGLLRNAINRYPHEFSGGQNQRIGIARALISRPKLLICDEPVSALDVSVQAQVVNLLQDLQIEFGLTMIFVAHDLGVVRHISDEILVMYLGTSMEYRNAHDAIADAEHPYAQALLSAVPVADPSISVTPQILEGELPSPINPPAGCPFSTRCPRVQDICHGTPAPVQPLGNGEFARCHFVEPRV